MKLFYDEGWEKQFVIAHRMMVYQWATLFIISKLKTTWENMKALFLYQFKAKSKVRSIMGIMV